MDSSEEITLQGHIIDSWLLPKVFDLIMDMGGSFDVGEIKVGRQKTERSFARIKVIAENEAHLERILVALQPLGAESLSRSDARTEAAPADGVLPDEFYSTTHMPTQIRLSGKWIDVENTEMDLVIRVEEGGAQMIPMGEVSRGDQIVVGHGGVRVKPLERSRSARFSRSWRAKCLRNGLNVWLLKRLRARFGRSVLEAGRYW